MAEDVSSCTGIKDGLGQFKGALDRVFQGVNGLAQLHPRIELGQSRGIEFKFGTCQLEPIRRARVELRRGDLTLRLARRQ